VPLSSLYYLDVYGAGRMGQMNLLINTHVYDVNGEKSQGKFAPRNEKKLQLTAVWVKQHRYFPLLSATSRRR
jgi:hypothetical protein